jgi:hypothetical protein
VKPIATQH